MDYNTTREKLKLPEYGRYIHDYVETIKSLPTKEERTKAAYSLVSTMAGINQTLRESADFRRKLWDHLMIIANFELDVDSPYPLPEKDLLEEKPEPLGYDNNQISKPHYGKIVEQMANCIPNYEGEQREELINIVANTMKKNYLNWNKSSVTDQTIINDLKSICTKEIDISNEMKLTSSHDLMNRSKNEQMNGSKNSSKNGGRSSQRNKNRKQNNNIKK